MKLIRIVPILLKSVGIVLLTSMLVFALSISAMADIKVKKGFINTILPEGGKLEYTQFEIPYGNGKKEVGGYDHGEGDLGYPEKLIADKKGNIYVLDNVNKRVQVYTGSGGHLHTIPIKQEFAFDLVVGENKQIFVQDISDLLCQYAWDGKNISCVHLDSGLWGGGIIALLKLKGSKLYSWDSSRDSGGPVVIARLKGGKLVAATRDDTERLHGASINSERRYFFKDKLRERKAHKTFIVKQPNMPAKEVVFRHPHNKRFVLHAIRDDAKGNVYLDGVIFRKRIYEAFKFSPDGDNICYFRKPLEEDGFPARQYYLRGDGLLYTGTNLENKYVIRVLDYCTGVKHGK